MAFTGIINKKIIYCLLFLLVGFATPVIAQAPDSNNSNILVIHSYNPELSWTAEGKKGIDEGFRSSHHLTTVYHEFLDAKRYPNLEHRKAFLNYLHTKYQDTELQVLIVADDPGLNMVLATRNQYFPDLPVVFMGINHVRNELLTIPWLTGVFETHSYRETILEAKRQTQSDNMIFLIDSTETGTANLKRLRQIQVDAAETLPDITVVKDLTPTTIGQTLEKYPSSWPVFVRGQLRSGDGNEALLPFEETMQLLRSQLKNPLYTVSSSDLGHGVVGGKVLEGSYHAKQAVELVEKILEGTPVDQVPPIINAKTQWIFDAYELKRFNINHNDLPPTSILINQKQSFYEQHRQLIWYVLPIFILGAITILVLVDAIRRQKQAEITLEYRVEERTNALSQTLQELKQTQAQLIQTEKLSSLGQLVGGIAHEFNNPLTFITGNIDILQGYGQDLLDLIKQQQQQILVASSDSSLKSQDIDLDYIQADMPQIFQSMTKGTERIKTIVRSLQSFASTNEQGTKPTDLNKSLDNTLLILRSRIGNDIEIITDYGDCPLVVCEPSAINQVFMQVLLNAIEAVNLLNKEASKQIFIHTRTQKENWITISIQDTGFGIPHSIQEKVFDPFFTTKPVGAGTGLGLAVSYQYIQQHNGRLTFRPNSPQGSIFVIELPIPGSSR
ncbi:sensor histidine kinase [Leptothoe spongobia]|uniref:histidine kinase n=1 Tax=Leptothoe spongobia TAU-MAC 1115 TaxID=1967444 RepID=A0A947DDV7_9CYAN|nr:ATP-binding protein [Leptothoe spongobia]MBT9315035.1 GHKL domain-containing protein [Leptothoe spongobia TAU-MAC 1115]